MHGISTKHQSNPTFSFLRIQSDAAVGMPLPLPRDDDDDFLLQLPARTELSLLYNVLIARGGAF